MAIVPAPVVPAPEPRGTRYGLLTVANGPLELPPHASGGGVRYEPVACGFARRYDVDCDPAAKTFDGTDAYVTGEPFVAYATATCSAVGKPAPEIEAKAQRRLMSGEQSVAEEALAESMAAVAEVLTAPDPDRLSSVVGELEEWLYGTAGANYGYVGFLHAPVRFASQANVHGQLVRDGNLWRTPAGSIWIFGGGYPDDGTVYISGTVSVWRSLEIGMPPAQFDRTNNVRLVVAEREYVVTFDCFAAVAEFTGEGTAS